MKISEILQQEFKLPLVWKLLMKLKADRRRIDWVANTPEGHVTGEIVSVRDNKIEVYTNRRYYMIPMQNDDDDRYDLERIPPAIGPDSRPGDETDPKRGYFRVIDQ
jgi:hypothetical protein